MVRQFIQNRAMVPSHCYAALETEAEKRGFPEKFSVQRPGVTSAKAIFHLPPQDIAEYFRGHPSVANDLLTESFDKRYNPSSFIAEEGDEYRVGLWSEQRRYECVKSFSSLADAATDYLML